MSAISWGNSSRKVLPTTIQREKHTTLARNASVSEPTVNRFCNRFDTSGNPDFKIQLALSLAKGTPYDSQTVDSDDNTEEFTNKIFKSTMAALEGIFEL